MLQLIKNKLGIFQQPQHQREFVRLPCRSLCWIEFVERRYQIEAMILDISNYGALVRPLSAFILDRTGSLVRIKLEHGEVVGELRNSTKTGYGVKFIDPLESEEVNLYAALEEEEPAGEDALYTYS